VVIDRAVAAMAKAQGVYQRDARLVSVRGWKAENRRPSASITRAVGQPTIFELPRSRVLYHLSKQIAWRRTDGRRVPKLGDEIDELSGKVLVPAPPPGDIVTAVHEAGEWPGVPPLRGLAAAPLLRLDGSVSASRGYDSVTGFFCISTGRAPRVPASPTRDDARDARNELLDLVSDFPFVEAAGPDAWLAALLTPVCRHLCDCVPAFLFDASAQAAGKSLLCDLIGIIASGRAGMARGGASTTDEECEKRLLAHCLAGDSLILFDNARNGSVVGWPSLDRFITSVVFESRVLRESRNARLPNVATVYMTGNNIGVGSDMGRRCIKVRLESALEHPEDRGDFKIDNLIEHVRENRAQLLGRALTIVAAYLHASRPAVGTRPLGSFEEWSRIVRDSVVWAGGCDAASLLVNRLMGADPEAEAHVALLVAWAAFPDGLTASEAIRRAYPPKKDGAADNPDDLALRDAIEAVCRRAPTPRALGEALRAFKNRRRTLPDETTRFFAGQPTRSRALRWTAECVESCRVPFPRATQHANTSQGDPGKTTQQHSTHSAAPVEGEL
jgi:hypothetical protein